MDFQSAMETFAEAWVAANTKPLGDVPAGQPPGLGPRPCKSPSCTSPHQPMARSPGPGTQPPATAIRLQESPPPKDSTFEGNKANCGKSLPVHCIVESVTALEEASWRRKSHIETDSYVIIPVNTAFHELVTVALHRLNYPAYLFNAAKGCLIIKNWKPLSFDKISDTSMNTVGDILGELTTVATLKIQIFKPRPSVLSEVKDKLLKLLLTQSHGLLLSTGCPLDEVTLSYLCRSPPISPGSHPMPPEPSEECRRKFEQWWSMQLTNQQAAHSHVIAHHSPVVSRYSPVENHSSSKLMDRPSSIVEGVHPALQTVSNQYPTQKTRMRTSFDPELELPKLQRWFADNQHPSRQQIQHYVKELNSLESRRGRKPLDVNNVVYWFKNARAAQKRAELRQTPGGLMGLNGYSSASHSPPTSGGRGPLMSPHSVNAHHMYNMQEQTSDASENDVGVTSDAEDDEELPVSLPEEVPLSLTTNDKSPHTPPLDGIKQEPPDAHNNNNTISSKEVDDLSDEDEEEDEDIDERKEDLGAFRTPSPNDMIVARQPSTGGPLAGFPLVPNSMFSHSIMYMSHYIPGLGHNIPNNSSSSSQGLNLSALDERRKRNRTFIDPVTEVPRLEQWFTINTHPSHNLILKYTEELNRMPYRQKFPRLESKNVQFWFKNRRAKCKRLKMSLYEGPQSTPPLSHMGYGGNRE